MVWYSHLFKNFLQFVLIHTVKGFGVVTKAEVDVFPELSCFFDDPVDVGNLISGSSAFSQSSLNIWKFTVHVLLKPGLENFEDYFTSMWDECNCVVVWAFFGIASLWDWIENWPFSVLWPLLSFQICWHIECSTFTASSFRIWNSSTGIPSPPLALFVVMLSKAHLTSHSKMSGSRWVTTTSWLSGSLRLFWIVFLCILAASFQSLLLLLGPYHFCPLSCPILHEMFPWYLQFLKKSLAFPILLFSSISLHSSFKKAFLYLLAILWNSALSWVYLSVPLLLLTPLFSAIYKASSDNHSAFLHLFFLGMVLVTTPVQCYEPPPIVPQVLCLPGLIPWICSPSPLYNHKGLDSGHGLVVSLLSST